MPKDRHLGYGIYVHSAPPEMDMDGKPVRDYRAEESTLAVKILGFLCTGENRETESQIVIAALEMSKQAILARQTQIFREASLPSIFAD